jgi:pheromone shutdown protein TraB
LSRLLLDVREEFMAARIRDIMYSTTGQVVGVVGYGHLKSLARALASVQMEPAYSTSITWSMMTG